MNRPTVESLPKPPDKRPDWMPPTSWLTLKQEYETTLVRLRNEAVQQRILDEARRLSDLSVKHYEDTLQTLTQHTIDEV